MAQRVISIFVSTPSDVVEERDALIALVSEINDVVTFLAPERNIRLEPIRYETHTYPDVVGAPQPVINRQIRDYDIYLGVMWKRCGTPTANADSGTIEEFNTALARREKTGKPTIMFYFGAEQIPMPTTEDEILQLGRVLKFRQRLETIGLTATYPTRADFREYARRGLLRAIADILREDLPEVNATARAVAPIAIPEHLHDLATQYDQARIDMKSGDARTRRMSQIFEAMKADASAARDSLALLRGHETPGHRLAAVAILQVFPSRADVAWLADRLAPAREAPFVGYQAALALLQAVRSLPNSDDAMLAQHLERAKALALENPHDPPRIRALDYALQELEVKTRGTSQRGAKRNART